MDTELLKRIRALAANDEGISAEGLRRLLAGYDALERENARLAEKNKAYRAQLFGWKGWWDAQPDEMDGLDSGLYKGTIHLLANP